VFENFAERPCLFSIAKNENDGPALTIDDCTAREHLQAAALAADDNSETAHASTVTINRCVTSYKCGTLVFLSPWRLDCMINLAHARRLC
jgi:hypothetical protein